MLCLLLGAASGWAHGQTRVLVTTPMGQFTIQLLLQDAPGTVANFLSYVQSGAYDGTFVHRAEVTPNPFVIQGGWLRLDESTNSANAIATLPNIKNEFRRSNLRGTVAMAKVAGDPDSANSQWFVNLADNSFLDSSNGGFTVFGQIDAAGMAVVDAISRLPVANLNASLPTTPVINWTGQTQLRNTNLVTVTMTALASHALNPTTGQIDIQVDAGSAGRLALSLDIVSLSPEGVVQVDAASVKPLAGNVSNLATFTESDNLLRIPELWVDGVVGYRNVVFRLTDAQTLRFTLVSFEQ
ncbi:MAG: hypothetical protein RLZZ385_1328 [Pseudomonadota bacterium]|jgi:peptidyl-prolyl cis-trans isomerase A (cyclophilin A)